jgi:DNA-binding MarR family transcriptional regulator
MTVVGPCIFLNEDSSQDPAAYGLTQSRTRVLWRLRQRGPTTQSELADAIGVSARTVTGLVDALVATGFVTREPHPADRRATLVTLTAHGAKTTDDLFRRPQELAQAPFAKMPTEPFDCLLSSLDDVLARCSSSKLTAGPDRNPRRSRYENAERFTATPEEGSTRQR